MSHDELTTYQLSGRTPAMNGGLTVYSIYGLRLHDGSVPWVPTHDGLLAKDWELA